MCKCSNQEMFQIRRHQAIIDHYFRVIIFDNQYFRYLLLQFLGLNQKVLMPKTKHCVRWKARIHSFPVHTLFVL